MNIKPKRAQAKRLGAMVVAGTMLLETVGPVYAAVSQVPGLYTTPPDANVMFTLDDSGSMQSDAIPDFINGATGNPLVPNSDLSDMPNNAASEGVPGSSARTYPGMWLTGTTYTTYSSYWVPKYYAKSNAIARYLRSSAGNPLYYDPTVTYLPWPTAADDKVLSPPAQIFAGTATPTQVRISRDNALAGGGLLNIKARVNVGPSVGDLEADNFWPATYFVYSGAPMVQGIPIQPLNAFGSFTKYEIKPSVAAYPRATSRSDCTGAIGAVGCTYDQELQNFANWLQYYRNRRLMAKGGVAAAFAKQGTNLRVGFSSINSSPVVRRGVSQFTGAARQAFYTDLYPLGGTSGTPLRKAMDDVGKYFQRSDVGNPWAENPSSGSVGKEYTCRKSVHIMSTDGFWKDAAATGNATLNNDAFTGNTPPKGPVTGPVYAFSNTASSTTDPLVGRFTINPFADGESNILSDVAAYYWRNDLRPDLSNDVSPSSRDPAFWQHLSTYTVGLGVSGTDTVRRTFDNSTVVPTGEPGVSLDDIGKPWLSTQRLRDLLISKKWAMTWPAVVQNTPGTGDDLIHASMSGRGRYLSATNPTLLAAGLGAVLAEATDNPGSLASVVTESQQVSTDTEVYQATYNPSQWSGRLYAFSQSATGAVNTTASTAVWEASNKMPLPDNRSIYTWNPTGAGAGSTFTWGGLTPTQQGNLASEDTLKYLRGSDEKELAQGGVFRDRSRYAIGSVTGGVLGDIVNGSPIKGPSDGGGYDKLPSSAAGQASYATYRDVGNTALTNMRNTLFAAANDGMLHAFDRINGVERFAFVPNSVFSVPRSLTGTEAKLKMLSDPAYTHRFTVDGPPQIGDAFIGPSAAASQWKTILLGSTGAGARSVFAMDITNPTVETGGFSESKLLWEFSEANNADMGYVISYPHIARMQDGTWVSIFGNGYDSVNGQAKLFILNLQTGAVLWQQSVGAAGGNGLSQPNFTVNNKREVTAIYAGDLKGNLWKFDVNDPNPSNWKVAFGSSPNFSPLFTGSVNQPIAVMPEITFHPNGGVMLSMGTGKLFEPEDTAATGNVNLNTQAIYGIWDKPGETVGFSGNTSLVPRLPNGSLGAATDATLSGTTSPKAGGGAGETVMDWTIHRGWYYNLLSGGERVNVNPQQAKSTLLVVANKPDTNPCSSGGSSRLFGLDPISGGSPAYGVFDANGSGTINTSDKGFNVKSISFAVLSLPALQTKKNVADIIRIEKIGTRGQTGERLGGVENKTTTPSDCAQWLLAGGSDTSIAGFDIALCSAGKPRISWRQLK